MEKPPEKKRKKIRGETNYAANKFQLTERAKASMNGYQLAEARRIARAESGLPPEVVVDQMLKYMRQYYESYKQPQVYKWSIDDHLYCEYTSVHLRPADNYFGNDPAETAVRVHNTFRLCRLWPDGRKAQVDVTALEAASGTRQDFTEFVKSLGEVSTSEAKMKIMMMLVKGQPYQVPASFPDQMACGTL